MRKNKIVFSLDVTTYSLQAIYATAYSFVDRVYVFLDRKGKKIKVVLESKGNLKKKGLEDLKKEFHNELLNYLLRVEIAKRNQKIRDFIVGTALVSALPTELLTQSSKPEISGTADWQKDPLGIAIPWEEKYGKKKRKTKKKSK